MRQLGGTEMKLHGARFVLMNRVKDAQRSKVLSMSNAHSCRC